MLSVQRCREILGSNCLLTDQELELLRDQMYGLAGIVLDQIGGADGSTANKYQTKPETDAEGYKTAVRLLRDEDREDVEERAAIIEFEGGADRDQAERKALLSVVRRHHETK